MSSLRTAGPGAPPWPRSLRDTFARSQVPTLDPARRLELIIAGFGEVVGRLAAIAWTVGATPPPDKDLVWGDWLKAALATGSLESPVAQELAQSLRASLPRDSALARVGTELSERGGGGRVRSVHTFLQAMVAYRNRWAHRRLPTDEARADTDLIASTADELAERLAILGRYQPGLVSGIEVRADGVFVCQIELPDGEPPPADVVARGAPPRPGDTWLFAAHDRCRPVGPTAPWLHVHKCGDCRAHRAFVLDRRKDLPEWLGLSERCSHTRQDLATAHGHEPRHSTVPTILDPLPAAVRRPERSGPAKTTLDLAAAAPEAATPHASVEAGEQPERAPAPAALGHGGRRWFMAGLAAGVALLLVLGLAHDREGAGSGVASGVAGHGSPSCPCVETPSTTVQPRCPGGRWDAASRQELVEAGTALVRKANAVRKTSPDGTRAMARDALGIYECARQRAPKDTRVLSDMGWAYDLAGDWPAAERAYQRAIRTEGHPRLVAAAQFGRGVVLCKMGRPGAAIASMQAALSVTTKERVQSFRERRVREMQASCQ